MSKVLLNIYSETTDEKRDGVDQYCMNSFCTALVAAGFLCSLVEGLFLVRTTCLSVGSSMLLPHTHTHTNAHTEIHPLTRKRPESHRTIRGMRLQGGLLCVGAFSRNFGAGAAVFTLKQFAYGVGICGSLSKRFNPQSVERVSTGEFIACEICQIRG